MYVPMHRVLCRKPQGDFDLQSCRNDYLGWSPSALLWVPDREGIPFLYTRSGVTGSVTRDNTGFFSVDR